MLAADTTTNQSAKPFFASTRLLNLLGVAAAIAVTLLIFMLRDRLQQLDQYGYAGIFLVTLIGNASLVLPAPAFLAAFAGGGVFNPWVVGVVAAGGATLGELTGYLAGASSGGLVGDSFSSDRVQVWMQRYGLLTLFVLALIPNPLFDVAGITAGALRLPLRHFLLATWAGKTIKFLLIAFVGSRAIELFS